MAFYSKMLTQKNMHLRCPHCGSRLVYQAKEWSSDHGTVHYTARLICQCYFTAFIADGKTAQEAEEKLISKL